MLDSSLCGFTRGQTHHYFSMLSIMLQKCSLSMLRIVENFQGRKLSREKTFTNFEVLLLFVKTFSTKLGGRGIFRFAKICCGGIFISNISPLDHIWINKLQQHDIAKNVCNCKYYRVLVHSLVCLSVSSVSHVVMQITPIVSSKHESLSHMWLQCIDIKTVPYLSAILPGLRSDDFSTY